MPSIRAKYLAIVCSMLLCMPLAQAKSKKNWKYSTDQLVKTEAFAPGQSVWLDANVGDIRILPNLDDHEIRLEIQGNHGASTEEMQSWVRQFDASGSQANIHLYMPILNKQTGRVTLYVPASTALNVNLGIGDLKIDGIAGDKDLSMNIGDLKLGDLDAEDYASVKLGTGIGDVKDKVFGGRTLSGFGRTKNVFGSGKYRLRAHVNIGDISLLKESISGTD